MIDRSDFCGLRARAGFSHNLCQRGSSYPGPINSAILAYRGRTLTTADLDAIRALLAAHPELRRQAFAQRLCEHWNWRQPNGALRDRVARSLLLAQHRAGHITLSPVHQQPPNNVIVTAEALPPGATPERTGVFTSGVVAGTVHGLIALLKAGPAHAGEHPGEVLDERQDPKPPIQMSDALARNTPWVHPIQAASSRISARAANQAPANHAASPRIASLGASQTATRSPPLPGGPQAALVRGPQRV